MARKKKHPPHVNHERWLVSYADFITLLFAFFTTLYAISTVDQKKAGKLMYSMRTAFNVDFFTGSVSPGSGTFSVIESILPALERAGALKSKAPAAPRTPQDEALSALARKLGDLSLDPLLKGKIQIRMEARGLVVSLAEAGFFPSGTAAFRPEAVDAILALARTIADPTSKITVEGHTDDVPVKNQRYASNWELSTARASAVVALLIEKAGIEPVRITAAGYGEYKPVAANDSAEGRARNRRVDIVISPQTTDLPAPDAMAPGMATPEPDAGPKSP